MVRSIHGNFVLELIRWYCHIDEKLADRPQRYWARARCEPAMLSIRNGRQPQLDLEVPVQHFTADGAYDERSIYRRIGAASTENVVIVLPPRRSAAAGPTDGPRTQHEAALQRKSKVGRREC